MKTKTKDYAEVIAKLREKIKTSSTDLQLVIKERDKAASYPLLALLFMLSPISILASYLDENFEFKVATIILVLLFVIGLAVAITVLIIFSRRVKILTDIRDYLLSSNVLNIKEIEY